MNFFDKKEKINKKRDSKWPGFWQIKTNNLLQQNTKKLHNFVIILHHKKQKNRINFVRTKVYSDFFNLKLKFFFIKQVKRIPYYHKEMHDMLKYFGNKKEFAEFFTYGNFLHMIYLKFMRLKKLSEKFRFKNFIKHKDKDKLLLKKEESNYFSSFFNLKKSKDLTLLGKFLKFLFPPAESLINWEKIKKKALQELENKKEIRLRTPSVNPVREKRQKKVLKNHDKNVDIITEFIDNKQQEYLDNRKHKENLLSNIEKDETFLKMQNLFWRKWTLYPVVNFTRKGVIFYNFVYYKPLILKQFNYFVLSLFKQSFTRLFYKKPIFFFDINNNEFVVPKDFFKKVVETYGYNTSFNSWKETSKLFYIYTVVDKESTSKLTKLFAHPVVAPELLIKYIPISLNLDDDLYYKIFIYRTLIKKFYLRVDFFRKKRIEEYKNLVEKDLTIENRYRELTEEYFNIIEQEKSEMPFILNLTKNENYYNFQRSFLINIFKNFNNNPSFRFIRPFILYDSFRLHESYKNERHVPWQLEYEQDYDMFFGGNKKEIFQILANRAAWQMMSKEKKTFTQNEHNFRIMNYHFKLYYHNWLAWLDTFFYNNMRTLVRLPILKLDLKNWPFIFREHRTDILKKKLRYRKYFYYKENPRNILWNWKFKAKSPNSLFVNQFYMYPKVYQVKKYPIPAVTKANLWMSGSVLDMQNVPAEPVTDDHPYFHRDFLSPLKWTIILEPPFRQKDYYYYKRLHYHLREKRFEHLQNNYLPNKSLINQIDATHGLTKPRRVIARTDKLKPFYWLYRNTSYQKIYPFEGQEKRRRFIRNKNLDLKFGKPFWLKSKLKYLLPLESDIFIQPRVSKKTKKKKWKQMWSNLLWEYTSGLSFDTSKIKLNRILTKRKILFSRNLYYYNELWRVWRNFYSFLEYTPKYYNQNYKYQFKKILSIFLSEKNLMDFYNAKQYIGTDIMLNKNEQFSFLHYPKIKAIFTYMLLSKKGSNDYFSYITDAAEDVLYIDKPWKVIKSISKSHLKSTKRKSYGYKAYRRKFIIDYFRNMSMKDSAMKTRKYNAGPHYSLQRRQICVYYEPNKTYNYMKFSNLIHKNFKSWNFSSYRPYQDATDAFQLGFQDPATPIMEGIIDFHNDVTFVLIVILFFVFWLLYITIRSFMVFLEKKDKKKVFNFPVKWYSNHNYNWWIPNNKIHNTLIEVVWTLTPSFILILIALPSFALLYSIDEIINPLVTLKAIGKQWYWSYQYVYIKKN
jgi:hypothetical protein